MERIAFVGAGAVGGYTGGHMARAGLDVTLIDPWAEHVAAIKSRGLHLGGTQGEHDVKLKALHISDVQRLAGSAVDIAFICMKLYHTAWATALITPYLAPGGVVVTMQNGLVEEQVAQIAGWGRTLGCIASTISVEAVAPGRIVRTQLPGGDAYTVFRVGEMSGLATPRAQRIAGLLRSVDSAKVTANLWGERWSKLTANTMTTGLCGASGLDLNQVVEYAPARRLQVRLAAEAIRIGTAAGFKLESIRGYGAEKWLSAAAGNAAALAEIEQGMLEGLRRRPEGGRSGTAQDLAKQRRTEVDFMNGYVAAKGDELGVPAPTHAAVAALVRRVERGELAPARENLHAAVRRVYSGLTPASLASFANFWISDLMKAPNCSGVSDAASTPSSPKRVLMSGIAATFAIAADNLLTTSAGVPAGASRPHHVLMSKSLSPPASAMVGSSGMTGVRCALVTASALSLPALIYGETAEMEMNARSTWPPSRSMIAGASPLYATCVSFTLASELNISPDRCGGAPTPDDA